MKKRHMKSPTSNRTQIKSKRKDLLKVLKEAIQQFATTHDTSQVSLK